MPANINKKLENDALFPEETPMSDLTHRAKLETKKEGVVSLITTTKIIIDYKGQGISVLFDKEKHATLKVGDKIDVP